MWVGRHPASFSKTISSTSTSPWQSPNACQPPRLKQNAPTCLGQVCYGLGLPMLGVRRNQSFLHRAPVGQIQHVMWHGMYQYTIGTLNTSAQLGVQRERLIVQHAYYTKSNKWCACMWAWSLTHCIDTTVFLTICGGIKVSLGHSCTFLVPVTEFCMKLIYHSFWLRKAGLWLLHFFEKQVSRGVQSVFESAQICISIEK